MEEHSTGDAPETQERRFANRLRQLRQKRGWNQSDLARELEKVGLNWKQQTVARAESEGRPLRLDEAHAIASLFGETVESMTSTDETRAQDLSIDMAATLMALMRSCTRFSELADELDHLYRDIPEQDRPSIVRSMKPDQWKTLNDLLPTDFIASYESMLFGESYRSIFERALPQIPSVVTEGWWNGRGAKA